jgi:hypothetical protein
MILFIDQDHMSFQEDAMLTLALLLTVLLKQYRVPLLLNVTILTEEHLSVLTVVSERGCNFCRSIV